MASLNVLLVTEQADDESILPPLGLIAPDARRAQPSGLTASDCAESDVAVVDACSNMGAARQACRRIATIAPGVAVVVAVSAENFVAIDLDWNVDEVVLATACTTELHTRLRLAVDRRRRAVDDTFRFGDLVLRPASYTASLPPNHQLDLTLTEFKLLNFLVHHAGRAFTRTRLMHEVWGHECGPRTVDVHVQRLRAKLGAEYESMVDTVRGVGYMATDPPQTVAAKPVAIAQ